MATKSLSLSIQTLFIQSFDFIFKCKLESLTVIKKENLSSTLKKLCVFFPEQIEDGGFPKSLDFQLIQCEYW